MLFPIFIDRSNGILFFCRQFIPLKREVGEQVAVIVLAEQLDFTRVRQGDAEPGVEKRDQNLLFIADQFDC